MNARRTIALVATRLLMLYAISASALAQDTVPQAGDGDAPALKITVRLERITVVPSPEDLPSPVKGRWQRFEETLNSGPGRKFRIIESATNNGIRMSCYEPCLMNCCASSGGFSLAGMGVWR